MSGSQRSRGVDGPHLRLVLWRAAKALEQLDRASTASAGMCLSDFAILEILLNKGPLPMGDISEKVLLTSGSATTAVDRLEERRLVVRKQDPADRRRRLVSLSAAGRGLARKVYARHAEKLEDAAGSLDREERKALLELLKRYGGEAARIAEDLEG